MTTVRGVFLNARTTKDFVAGDTIFDQREFLSLVHETPTFALEVMSSLAERLRRVNTQS